jgi:uncharacterized zinc-type alcohol dehydrogenase-like protein
LIRICEANREGTVEAEPHRATSAVTRARRARNIWRGMSAPFAACMPALELPKNLRHDERTIADPFRLQEILQAASPTQGGYSTQIVVDEHYVLRIPSALSPAGAAPLLRVGITTYSPLRHWGVGKYHKLAVVGLGGLGHMAVKIGKALGTEVTVLSSSERKRNDAERLGGFDFALTSQSDTFTRLQRHFDFILDTISAPHNYNAYVNLLKTDGSMILVGAPDRPTLLEPFPLILNRRSIAGSVIRGIRETQKVLDFCATQGIESDIEMIPIQQVNGAYERVLKGDVRVRFVIDMASLK